MNKHTRIKQDGFTLIEFDGGGSDYRGPGGSPDTPG